MAKPFVKWMGGKAKLVPDIIQRMPDGFGDYWEPFLGGGAVFFALRDAGIIKGQAWLSDANEELIISYNAIKTFPWDVVLELSKHRDRHCEAYYYHVRGLDVDKADMVSVAARFIYLNKACFNGVYRVNKAGKFNVPFSKSGGGLKSILDVDVIADAHIALKNTVLNASPFQSIDPQNGDLVYCDPPYDGAAAGYTSPVFDRKEHLRLRDFADKWRRDGVHVLVSNSDTGYVRELYGQGWDTHEVYAARSVNRDGSGRGKVKELLIYGCPL